MGKYSIPKGQTFEEAAKIIRENGERIAKEIGGHIPERVVDDGLLTPNELKNIKYITIPLQEYIDAIRDAGYYQGLAEGLEKQLEELKRSEEVIALEPERKYKEEIKDRLKGEIERLEHLKGNGPDTGGGIIVAKTRINGKIEGIEYAIDLINKEDKCEK